MRAFYSVKSYPLHYREQNLLRSDWAECQGKSLIPRGLGTVCRSGSHGAGGWRGLPAEVPAAAGTLRPLPGDPRGPRRPCGERHGRVKPATAGSRERIAAGESAPVPQACRKACLGAGGAEPRWLPPAAPPSRGGGPGPGRSLGPARGPLRKRSTVAGAGPASRSPQRWSGAGEWEAVPGPAPRERT